VLVDTNFVARASLGEHGRKDSRVSHEQGHIEGWTALVFLGLAVASAVAAAAARGWGAGKPQAS
jgi:hypothetical protein